MDPQCSGHGICHDEKCYCEDGYRGMNCEETYPVDGCERKEIRLRDQAEPEPDADPACTGRGRIDPESGQCLCIPGYHGKKCELGELI